MTTPEANLSAGGSTDRSVIELERLLPATPERVFDAFVDPRTLTKWWGPEQCTAPDVELNVHEDGSWRTVIVGPDGSRSPVGGIYREIDRPNRLRFSWAWENEDGSAGDSSEVELRFKPAGDGTHLTLTHRQLANAKACEQHQEGWQSSLNDLERMLG